MSDEKKTWNRSQFKRFLWIIPVMMIVATCWIIAKARFNLDRRLSMSEALETVWSAITQHLIIATMLPIIIFSLLHGASARESHLTTKGKSSSIENCQKCWKSDPVIEFLRYLLESWQLQIEIGVTIDDDSDSYSMKGHSRMSSPFFKSCQHQSISATVCRK